MANSFSIEVGGHKFDVLSQNVKAPNGFQLFAETAGKRKRYHLQRKEDKLQFTMPEDTPQFLLDLEKEIVYEIEVGWEI